MKIIAIYSLDFFTSIEDIYNYIKFVNCECLVWEGNYLIEYEKID